MSKTKKVLTAILSLSLAVILCAGSAFASMPIKLSADGKSISAPRAGEYDVSVDSAGRLITAVYDRNGTLNNAFVSDSGNNTVSVPTLDGMVVKNFLLNKDTIAPLQAVQKSGLNVLVDSAKKRARVRWQLFDKIDGITSYEVYRDGIKIASLTGADKAVWYDKDVLDGNTYSYSVFALDAKGEILAVSNEVSATVKFDVEPSTPNYPTKPEVDYSSITSYTLDVTKLTKNENGEDIDKSLTPAKTQQTWTEDGSFGLTGYPHHLSYDETDGKWYGASNADHFWTINDGCIYTRTYSGTNGNNKYGKMNIKVGTNIIPENSCKELVISFKTKAIAALEIYCCSCNGEVNADSHSVVSVKATKIGKEGTTLPSANATVTVSEKDSDGWCTVNIVGCFKRSDNSDTAITGNILRVESASGGEEVSVKDLSVMTAEEAAEKEAIDAAFAVKLKEWETECTTLKNEYDAALAEYNKSIAAADNSDDSSASFSVNYDSSKNEYSGNEDRLDELFGVREPIGAFFAVEYTTVEGKPCVQTVNGKISDYNRERRIGFAVDNTYMYGTSDNYAEITVEFFDDDNSVVNLYYESASGASYADFKKTGTNTWKKHTFIIEDANFTDAKMNYVDNADFQIYQTVDLNENPVKQLSVASVTVNKYVSQKVLRDFNKVYVIGDSIANSWSSRLGYKSGITVENHTDSTASTKTFANFDAIENDMQKGDYVFISFGHNDAKGDNATTVEEYTKNYNALIDNILERGGIPVIITTIPKIDADGIIYDAAPEYVAAAKGIANERSIICVDLAELFKSKLESKDVEERKELYTTDYVNINTQGSVAAATIINTELKNNDKIVILKDYIN